MAAQANGEENMRTSVRQTARNESTLIGEKPDKSDPNQGNNYP